MITPNMTEVPLSKRMVKHDQVKWEWSSTHVKAKPQHLFYLIYYTPYYTTIDMQSHKLGMQSKLSHIKYGAIKKRKD